MRTIVHISDLHFGGIAPGTSAALLDQIAALAPDVVVVSGDLTLTGANEEFRLARAFLDSITQPTLTVPGNHDIPAYALLERFLSPLGRYRRHITPDLAPTIVDGELALLGLNTARPWDLSWNWSHGRFSRRQVRQAAAFYGARSAPGLKCLVMHHPLIVPEELPGFRRVGRAEDMLAVLARHEVDLVLSGHLHQGFWRCREISVEPAGRRVLVVQASTATSTRRRDQPNAFNHLRIQGDSLALTPWNWDGSKRCFRAADTSAFLRLENGWKPTGGPAVTQTTPTQVEVDEAHEPAADPR